jgi:hypothetical protein
MHIILSFTSGASPRWEAFTPTELYIVPDIKASDPLIRAMNGRTILEKTEDRSFNLTINHQSGNDRTTKFILIAIY